MHGPLTSSTVLVNLVIDNSRVTQTIGRVRRDRQPELARLKGRGEQVYDSLNRTAKA